MRSRNCSPPRERPTTWASRSPSPTHLLQAGAAGPGGRRAARARRGGAAARRRPPARRRRPGGRHRAERARADGRHRQQPRRPGRECWLAQRFPVSVSEPVRLHVAAKRYLCATEPSYFGQLSEASVYTLSVQGGPMTDAEAREFEREPHAADAIAVRRWDDQAKDPSADVPDFDHYRPPARVPARSAPKDRCRPRRRAATGWTGIRCRRPDRGRETRPAARSPSFPASCS